MSSRCKLTGRELHVERKLRSGLARLLMFTLCLNELGGYVVSGEGCVSDNPLVPPKHVRRGVRSRLNESEYQMNSLSLLRSVTSIAAAGHSAAANWEEIKPYKLDGLKILDFGCGPGRLLHALQLAKVCYGKYVGVDVEPKMITWLENAHPNRELHTFIHVNTANERYNQAGEVYDPEKQGGPLDNFIGQFHLIVLRSVFSHMRFDDIVKHLAGLRRMLHPKGLMVVTLFTQSG